MTPSSPRKLHPALRQRLRSLRTTLVVAALFAMSILWLIDHTFRQLGKINVQRQDIELVRSTIGALNDNFTLAESSQRGFLLTGSARDLGIFDRTEARVHDLLGQLDNTVSKLPPNALAVGQFKQDLTEQMEQMRATVALYRAGQEDAARVAVSLLGVEADMQEVRDGGSRLMSQAQALLANQKLAFDRLVNYSRLAFLACVLTVLFGFLLYIQQRYRLRQLDLERQLLLQTERDRLESQVRSRTHELAALATYLQQVVEQERARLARELHDELGALMTSAKLDVARMSRHLPAGAQELSERLTHLKSTLSEAVALKRQIMEDLYPSALRNLGLVPALDMLVRKFAERSDIEIHADLQALSLEANTQLTVYRLVQEALTNIAKHARADHVRIRVFQDADSACVHVRDNGRGFDLHAEAMGTHGLAGMRHRLRSCGGELRIETAPGEGTEIIGRIPLPHSTAAGGVQSSH